MISFKKNIDDNWKKLMSIVDNYFEGEQYDNIMKLHKHFEDRIKTAPASGRPTYHNCFKGGYLDHVIRVTENALKVKSMFSDMSVKVIHSDSDIVLAAMFHDLGKVGSIEEDYYVYQTDEWRRNKLSEWYVRNENLEIDSVTDRSLWLLSKFNIDVSEEVFKAIKLSDGMFSSGNEKSYRRPDNTRNILYYIVHFSDWMSTVSEKQHYLQSLDIDDEVSDEKVENLAELQDAFDKLFD